MFGYISTVLAVPSVDVANVQYNTQKIIDKIKAATEKPCDIIVFPELCVTGSTCGDLFLQKSLIKAAASGVSEIAEKTAMTESIIVLGAPLKVDGQLYNCAVVLCSGEIVGIVPKTFLGGDDRMENSLFSKASDLTKKWVTAREIGVSESDYVIPVGTDLIFSFGDDVRFACELGADLYSPLSPSVFSSLSGAQIIINLSASCETVGKRQLRRDLIKDMSKKTASAYLYVSAGKEESTTDNVYAGHSVVCEKGKVLKENSEFISGDYILYADIDTEKIEHDRMTNKLFKDAATLYSAGSVREVVIERDFFHKSKGESYEISHLPFIPSKKEERLERCKEIFDMQVAGLTKRLKKTGAKPVIGVSGGLDSTLALLVCAKAIKDMGRPMTDVVGITMPCFGTSDRTYNNALLLMKNLGITSIEIPIKKAVLQHFEDIGQEKETYDLTFENSQARERTQVLMDYSGKIGGLVVGTGDLSELVLGWCTYNADHMSMYGVNGGIPKTLVRWVVDSIIESDVFPESADVLKDVIDTPISPELLPPDAEGKISQQTEDLVGPYALHDFFIYYTLRYGFEPKKVYFLAEKAFEGMFDKETILKWLKTFYRRFFTQQFKRSCQPDGIKVGSVGISPRGDLKMPSDASFSLWLEEAENL